MLAGCGSNGASDALALVDTSDLDVVELAAEEDAESEGSTSTTSSEAVTTAPLEELQSESNGATIVAAPDTETASDDADETPSFFGSVLAPEGETTVWSGVIDNDIPFTMWVAQNGDLIEGQLTYASSEQPITVLGRAYPSGDGYLLREFAEDGEVGGTMILGNVADGIVSNASWENLDLSLAFAGMGDRSDVFTPVISGTEYYYAFQPAFDDVLGEIPGPLGQLRISELADSSAVLSISTVDGGLGRSQAIVPPTEVVIDGNVARFDENDGDFIDCAFDVTFFEGYAWVEHVNQRFACGFANPAGVEGVYVDTTGIVATENTDAAADGSAVAAADGSAIAAADGSAIDESLSALFADAQLTPTSYGPISLGDSWVSLIERFGVEVYNPANEISEDCHYVNIPNLEAPVGVMLLGDGSNAVVSRIDLWTEGQTTDNGFGVGSTEVELFAFYGNGLISEPHYYAGEGARYLRVEVDGDATSTILFETDQNGTVTSFRNGYADPVRYVEGCA